jgi:hypothetical protein
VTIGFAVLDLRRPALEQGSLGRFLSALGRRHRRPGDAARRRANGSRCWTAR